MIKSITHFLRQPYPYYFGGAALIKLCAALFLLAFSYNYFIEPFDINPREHRMDYFWICMIHSAFPTMILFGYFTLLKIFGYNEEKWTIGNEIFHLALVFLLIGIQNFLIRDIIYDNPYNWTLRYLTEEIRNTFLSGLLLLAIIVPVNYSIQLRRNLRSALAISNTVHQQPLQLTDSIQIAAQVQADSFVLPIDRFLFAKAEGNYVEIYLQQEDDTVVKLLKRLPLKDLESQLAHIPSIIKTHRAYLVNKHQINSVNGNAQGYQIALNGYNGTVPVSRSLIGTFEQQMSA